MLRYDRAIIKYLFYIITFICVIIFDRITKNYVVAHCAHDCVGQMGKVSFELTFNRGISWGLFNSKSPQLFFVITLLISLVTLVLIFYAISRLLSGHNILGETFVIAGSISNILDRFLYGGVIDFIVVNLGPITWPVFNLADVAIVIGVFIMFLQALLYS